MPGHISGHLVTCNSAALKRRHYPRTRQTRRAEEPSHDSATGEPTGVLGDNAARLVDKIIPHPTIEDARKNFNAVQQYYASFGYTTAQDGATSEAIARLLRDEKKRKPKPDVISYRYGFDADKTIADLGNKNQQGIRPAS